ncbi:MAG: hypothetical protein AVDCRST_MAG56-3345 [uncultured Cytophagales bacterium]|uniref:Acyltransferase 3 domain-containing protein n=1 Tax=uncultured Cytophagales bacterium TaxID=158755 RepID=A0A6J4J9X5_9SPHI|nr:MAG: hypothetical protein AVDCRST_MAG56-3345 [uncultured Cytophagales bacterium]
MKPLISSSNKNQLDSLVLLRGIAVLLVCFCHFARPLSQGHALAGLFGWFDDYGRFGVHVFFVISGFVIPLSLWHGKYQIRDYGRFLYKRLLRLHPPYLAALALTLLIMFFSYKVRHVAFPESALSILQSMVYFHVPRDNQVYWTLMVEAQYYLFIGLFFSSLMAYPRVTLCVVTPILLALTQVDLPFHIRLLSYLPFFLVGTIGFLIYTNHGKQVLNVAALSAVLIFSFFVHALPAFVATITTVICIIGCRIRIPQILRFPGKISYSMYLIHIPIGIKFINLAMRRLDPAYSGLLFLVTMIVLFVVSWLFYKIFEEFSENLSRKIKYKAARSVQVVKRDKDKMAVA